MVNYLNFEKSLSEIEGRIRELNEVRLDDDNSSVSLDEINKLEVKAQETLEAIYKDLSTWEKTQVARHP
jgi:acetyl-CoA carboxylase carboxyl transferase subunit alpha